VSLPQFGIDKILAKIDTGAYRCRMHCDSARKTSDGQIHVVVAGQEYVTKGLPKRIRTKSITGHEKVEPVVATQLIIRGHSYDTEVVLSNRKDMSFAVVIGRKFLYDNGFMVDVERGIEYDIEYNFANTEKE
jgi:hypothetical protein